MTEVAIIFTIVIHTLGVPVMIWAVRGEEGMRGLFSFLPKKDEDGGGDGGSRRIDPPIEPDLPPSGGGLPLPESEPSRGRLREHGDRLANPARRPRRRERPGIPAQPVPERERLRD